MRFQPTRREFLSLVPAVLAAPTLIGCASRQSAHKAPTTATPQPAGPRIAVIGCGGRGWDNLNDLLGAGASVVALCDVDANARENGSKKVEG